MPYYLPYENTKKLSTPISLQNINQNTRIITLSVALSTTKPFWGMLLNHLHLSASKILPILQEAIPINLFYNNQ